jgi:DNA-binding protein HU-beta
MKPKVITKSEIVEELAKKTKTSKKDAQIFLNTLVETLQDNLKKGNSIRIIPFGTFDVRERKARTGRNPRTGTPIKIKARKVPAFRPGKGLKDTIK